MSLRVRVKSRGAALLIASILLVTTSCSDKDCERLADCGTLIASANLDDNGKTFDLREGEPLSVGLPANPPALHWQSASFDSAVLAEERVVYRPWNTPPRLEIGPRGFEIFRFRAIGSGRTHLRFHLVGMPEQPYEIVVNVSDGEG